jgi:hypothetical protein
LQGAQAVKKLGRSVKSVHHEGELAVYSGIAEAAGLQVERAQRTRTAVSRPAFAFPSTLKSM